MKIQSAKSATDPTPCQSTSGPSKSHPNLTGRNPAIPLGSIPDCCRPVFIHERVLDEILEYSDQHKNAEVGGFLLGSNFIDPAHGPYIEVTDYLPATNVASGYRSLTFTHETWSRLHQQIAKQFADRRVVGWHHTHPGFGIFLSRHDEFIHRHFFDQPWQIALVVDPRRQELGLFQWQNQEIVNSGFVCVPRAGRQASPPKSLRKFTT